MTKILSTASLAPVRHSSLRSLAARILRAVLAQTGDEDAAGHSSLPARLRYDAGELDINPDCARGRSHGAATSGAEREMMRRSF